MKKFMTAVTATALAASMAIGSVLPVTAAPMTIAPAVPAASDVQKVQEWRWLRNGNRMNSDHMRHSLGEAIGPGAEIIRDRNWRRYRDWRRHGRHWSRDWDGPRYYRGHRGYRHWRRGYREYNGWWFPLAAFTAGAVIGSAISEPRVVYRNRGLGDAHVEWCYNRYRSYRASDNTFQPYNGPRKQCYSPYS